MTDFLNNLSNKIKEKTNYDEKTSEKRLLKEQIFRQKLQQAQVLIAENYSLTQKLITKIIDKTLSKRLRFDVAYHMKIYMSPDELKETNQLKDEYTSTTYKVAAISLINVICASAFIKGFMDYKWYTKFAIGAFIFGTSHYAGMYQMEQKTQNYQENLMNKYREQFLSSNFIKNRLTYDPSIPDPHLQVRQKEKMPKLALDEEIE